MYACFFRFLSPFISFRCVNNANASGGRDKSGALFACSRCRNETTKYFTLSATLGVLKHFTSVLFISSASFHERFALIK